jgi:diguanylate cyclase (GGDEF)-like protein/PAS domain S-box-containing protein
MGAKEFKIALWIGLAAVSIGLCLAAMTAPFHHAQAGRVVKVGVDHSPPFYSVQADGSVKGLAVDVMNEAARRRGIQLQWAPLSDTPIDEALKTGKVDLWPLASSTNTRQKLFFISDPWLESDFVIVSTGSHPIHNEAEAAGQVIAHARLRGTASVAEKYLPASKLLVKRYRADAIAAVCAGEASGALVESLLLDAILLDRPKGCEQQVFKIASLPRAIFPLSIVSVRQAAPAAWELRKEISTLASDGFLSRKLDEWTPFSAQGTRSIWAREEAEERSRIYRICLGLILVFALFLIAEVRRAFRQKRAAQRMLAELQASEQRWQLALTGAGDGLWDWDLVSRTIFRSPGWKSMLGYQENAIGENIEDWRQLLHPDDAERAQAAIDAHLKHETAAYSCDYRLRAQDGTWRWVSDRGQAVWDEQGKPVRMAGSHTDITARMQEQESLSLEARTDGLTGLWNRREFDRALQQQTQLARTSGVPLTVCAFDLDEFKSVNDLHGHAAGDRVLIKFAELLKESLRKRDISCRTGGDEFVVILPETTSEQAAALAARVCTELRRISFESQAGAVFRVRCSFGVGQFGADDLLAAADELLYQAKQKARRKVFAA